MTELMGEGHITVIVINDDFFCSWGNIMMWEEIQVLMLILIFINYRIIVMSSISNSVVDSLRSPFLRVMDPGKKKASVLEAFLAVPTCTVRPNLASMSIAMVVPLVISSFEA